MDNLLIGAVTLASLAGAATAWALALPHHLALRRPHAPDTRDPAR
jgi:hypothetical protein